MNAFKIKQCFFKYINRAEYAIAISATSGFIFSTLVMNYNNYLGDRNKRIVRLNKQPLNHIIVDYISLEEYEYMINKDNWKPSNLRKKQENYENKTEKLLDMLNKWLLNQAKMKTKKSEVTIESLKKLKEFNNSTYIQQDKQTQNNNIVKNENQTLSSITYYDNIRKNNKQENIEQQYFIVQKAGSSARNDPLEFRKKNKKQNNEIKTENITIGKIAGKDVKKDANIFESIKKLWHTIIYGRDKKYGQVINTGYDQYGNRIIKKNSKTKNKIQNNYINNNIHEEETNQDENNNMTSSINFLNPTFIIDGNLQNAESSQFKEIAIKNNLNAKEIKMLTYLEYTFEKCWYQRSKNKYKNTSLDLDISIFYEKNANISNITINNYNKQTNNETQNFINDVIETIKTCKISNIENLTKDNYDLWGKINIRFTKK